jgi:hypothetical protein
MQRAYRARLNECRSHLSALAELMRKESNDGLMQAVSNPVRLLDVFSYSVRSASPLFCVNSAVVSSMYIVTARIRWAYTICPSPQFGHCASWRTSSFTRGRSVSVITLTVTPHLQRHVATPLIINLGLPRQVAVIQTWELIQTSEQRATAKKVLPKQVTSALIL